MKTATARTLKALELSSADGAKRPHFILEKTSAYIPMSSGGGGGKVT